NGGPLQTDSTFTNLAPGTYTLYVEDAAGCHNTLTETVRAKNTITLSFGVDTTSCNGSPDGAITVIPLSGSAPFLFSINNGPFQPSATFTGLIPGNYIINATDANGCASMPDLMITVPPGPGLSVNTQTTPTSCSGANNGTITVLPQNGTAPFNYSLNSGTPQASNTFTNLASGFYIITVMDANGCSATNIFANVETGQPLSGSVNTTDVTCNSGNNGSAIITISNGVGPYQYSLDNISYQPGNSFSGLAAGNYIVYFKDNNSCSGTQTFTINEPPALSATATSSAVKCRGEANGNITLSPSGGTSPYQYSLDGVNYQSSPTFIVAAGNYAGYVKDNNGCIASVNTITITEPLPLQANASTQNASCGAGNDGRINITATGGNGSYKYSIDGVNFQTSALFSVSPGSYI
ncbi:MAG: SprB repeat-containing protein, partial [Bacteroidetes bacterium]|nr:SprB repeat-containing protein [Bacteroidota bacterium]